MKTKEELLEKIKQIPRFRLRDVSVKESNAVYDKDGEILNKDELDEKWYQKDRWKAVTEENSTEPLVFVSDKYQFIQMESFFAPIVIGMGDCEGDIVYKSGFAIMDIFPKKKEYDTGRGRVGIVAYDSVDKTSALNIKFCVLHGAHSITIPAKVASFRKIHLGKFGNVTRDYIDVITKVKDAWDTIVTKFGTYTVEIADVKDLCKQFGVGERGQKYITKKMKSGFKYNLWDFAMDLFDYIGSRNFKSAVHKRKRLDKFVDKIFEYEVVMEI